MRIEQKYLEGMVTHAKEDLPKLASDFAENLSAEISLAARLHTSEPQSTLFIALTTPEKTRSYEYPFGGANELAPEWAANLCLSLLCQTLSKKVL